MNNIKDFHFNNINTNITNYILIIIIIIITKIIIIITIMIIIVQIIICPNNANSTFTKYNIFFNSMINALVQCYYLNIDKRAI